MIRDYPYCHQCDKPEEQPCDCFAKCKECGKAYSDDCQQCLKDKRWNTK